MQRRPFLAAIAGGLGLAGCSGDTGGEQHTATSPSPATDSPTPRPGTAPTARVLGATATATDGLRVRAERWFALDAVRYEPAGGTPTPTAGPPTVVPRRGRFVVYDFRLENVSEERLPAVRDSVFRLRVAGATFRHRHSLRGVPFSRVRQPEEEPQLRPLVWYDGLDPGASVGLQLVFDAPARPAFRHYLAWDHPAPVAGHDGPVYLWPRSVETGTDGR